jgi:RNA polymerase sigma-70 factor, ECF subfamily
VSERGSKGCVSEEAAEAFFEQIYRQEFDFIWRLVRRFGARERDREDLAHDVFVAVHRSLPTYDRQRPLRPWLFGVTFRVVSDYRRRARFDREIPVEEHTTASTAPVAHQALEQGEREALVAEGLERLPIDQRAVFVMHELEGESVPEIARGLGISDNTCYSRLRLARERFTKAVRAISAARSPIPLEDTE